MVVGMMALVGVLVIVGGIAAYVMNAIESGAVAKSQRDHLSASLSEQVEINEQDRELHKSALENLARENETLQSVRFQTELSLEQAEREAEIARERAADLAGDLEEAKAAERERVICPVDCEVDWR